MLSLRQCRLADAARRQCCHRDNADAPMLPGGNAVTETMLTSSQCRNVDAARRQCCHRDNAGAPMLPGGNAVITTMLTMSQCRIVDAACWQCCRSDNADNRRWDHSTGNRFVLSTCHNICVCVWCVCASFRIRMWVKIMFTWLQRRQYYRNEMDKNRDQSHPIRLGC